MIFPYRVGRFEFENPLARIPGSGRDLSIRYIRYGLPDQGTIENVSPEDVADLIHGLTVLLDMYKEDRRNAPV